MQETAVATRQKGGSRGSRTATAAICLVALLAIAGTCTIHFAKLHFDPVLSGSMRPKVQPGDLAILSPVPVSSLRVGEVIAYLPPNHVTPVMHRIISIDSHGVITKGDANPVADPWGRVSLRGTSVEHMVGVIPHAGWLTDIRSQLMLSIGVLLILILALAVLTPGRDKTDGTQPDGAPLDEIVDLRRTHSQADGESSMSNKPMTETTQR